MYRNFLRGMGSYAPIYIGANLYHVVVPYIYTMIPNSIIEKIKEISTERIDEVIGDFVSLKKRGNQLCGLSPFSNERTPSFWVNVNKGFFKDFSSGEGGDAIYFLQKSQNWNFTDAIKYLGRKFNVDIENNDFDYKPVQRDKVVIPTSYLPNDLIEATLTNYNNNALFKYLITKFETVNVIEAFMKYNVGVDQSSELTSDYTIFWQLDKSQKLRSGKYIKYQPDGHRDKSASTSWHHNRERNGVKLYPEFNLVQCFFGEHLLNDSNKRIAIVESEKTAVIASLCIDTYIWIACCSKYGLNEDKCAVLKNKSVTLFPDAGCYNEWRLKANEFGFSISDIVEKKATDMDKQKGYDLADLLLR